MARYDLHERAASIVRDAGGRIIGRTRLQKVAYLSQLAGFTRDFPFEYRHYGPFSEELAEAMEIASGVALVNEDERATDWGGWYSVYSVEPLADITVHSDANRERFVATAAAIGAIELELAATAAYLYAEEGIGDGVDGDPWEETARRKPDKSGQGRIERAKRAYRELQKLKTPTPLPPIS